MSLRDGPLGDVRPPILWVAVLALVVAAGAAFVLFLGARREAGAPRPLGPIREAAEGILAPVSGALAVPTRWFGDGLGTIGDYVLAGGQNADLRRKLASALSWRDEALLLKAENARLRALMNVRTDPPLPVAYGRVIADARGPFANSRLVDVGAASGVVEGNPALSEHGLVGRVTGVAPGVSRVMLLTDPQSRTPVLIARTNGRAILTGDGGPAPLLAYLRTHVPLAEGDRILTSGDGGVLPRGLPVGAATRGADGAWRVALDSADAPMDFVQILLFKDFAQLQAPGGMGQADLPSTATEPPPPPPAPEAHPSAAGPAGR